MQERDTLFAKLHDQLANTVQVEGLQHQLTEQQRSPVEAKTEATPQHHPTPRLKRSIQPKQRYKIR